MAHLLIMPRQGNSVESCVLVAWKVRAGDTVTAETPVCEVETDKATFEVPAGAAGTVLKLLSAAGDEVPVLQAIAVIGAPGEVWEGGQPDRADPADPADPADRADRAERAERAERADRADPVERAAAGSSPRARQLAAREAVGMGALRGSGPGGRVIARDVRAALEARPPLSAAAKAAARAGAPLPAAGSGLGGRITTADLSAARDDFPGPFADTPIEGIRKRIAARLLESHATTAPFTLHGAAEATRLQALRARFKAAPPELGLNGVTLNDLLLYVVARLLPRFPLLNAHKRDATVRTFARVHLGVAVDTPRGLMVPVLRDADRLPLAAIAAETRRLGEACRGHTVKPEELRGATFTVTNLGALGVEFFTPVLNIPEVAILGLGGLTPRPVLDAEGRPARFAPYLGLSLTIDHQVVDGYPAAQFLKALREAIADIDIWLLPG